MNKLIIIFVFMFIIFVSSPIKRVNTWKDYRKDFGVDKIVHLVHNKQNTCHPKEPVLKLMNFLEGMMILALLQISFYVPITEHTTRVLLIFIPLLSSLYLNKSQKQEFLPSNMFFTGIFMFTACACAQYITAFVSVERIRQKIQKKSVKLKGFVTRDEQPATESKDKNNQHKPENNVEVKIEHKEVPLPLPLPLLEDKKDKEETPVAEIKMPEEATETSSPSPIIIMPGFGSSEFSVGISTEPIPESVDLTAVNTSSTKILSVEKPTPATKTEPFIKIPVIEPKPEKKSTEMTTAINEQNQAVNPEIKISSEVSIPTESEPSRSPTDLLKDLNKKKKDDDFISSTDSGSLSSISDMTEDSLDLNYLTRRGGWTVPSLKELKEERRQRKKQKADKRAERRLLRINNKLHLMYSVSYLPADEMARRAFFTAFLLYFFFFALIYLM